LKKHLPDFYVLPRVAVKEPRETKKKKKKTLKHFFSPLRNIHTKETTKRGKFKQKKKKKNKKKKKKKKKKHWKFTFHLSF